MHASGIVSDKRGRGKWAEEEELYDLSNVMNALAEQAAKQVGIGDVVSENLFRIDVTVRLSG